MTGTDYPLLAVPGYELYQLAQLASFIADALARHRRAAEHGNSAAGLGLDRWGASDGAATVTALDPEHTHHCVVATALQGISPQPDRTVDAHLRVAARPTPTAGPTPASPDPVPGPETPSASVSVGGLAAATAAFARPRPDAPQPRPAAAPAAPPSPAPPTALRLRQQPERWV